MTLDAPSEQPSPASLLWQPAANDRLTTRLGAFWTFCEQRAELTFGTYEELWRWSVGDDPRAPDGLEQCWASIWEFFDVMSSSPYTAVLDARQMPGARWFDGARVNYAEHALRMGADAAVAIVGRGQTRDRVTLTWGELRRQVTVLRANLLDAGVRQGDRVAAYLPNIPEAVVAFLATASIGAIWTSCAPEFGVQAVVDRFSQVEPTVLFAVDGYRYGTRAMDRSDEVAAIRAGLPSVKLTVHVDHLHPAQRPAANSVRYSDMTSGQNAEPPRFDHFPFDHPLYILYSSGTTGLPKPIVHSHGGILIEHFKAIGLHGDMGADDHFFWFTTTGWMMWNYLISGLLVGARLILFDGDPMSDGTDTLWALAEDEGVTWMGLGAPFIEAARHSGDRPTSSHDLSRLRAIGSTGSPLAPECFGWVYDAVGSDVMLSPISGGTDICSAFVGGSPLTPVWEGEMSCRYLGCAVRAFDEDGSEVINREGELVVTQPMPSMPVGFWGDTDQARYRASYFETYPRIWRHGDWITISERGSCVISGRSDATLNRAGIRVGTAEIYRVVESVPGVVDSLIVDVNDPGAAGGLLILLVVVAPTTDFDDEFVAAVRSSVRQQLSPRHVPDEIHRINSVPTTLSGKKLELPVKRILNGADPDAVASRGALKDPTSLDAIAHLAVSRR